MCRVDLDAVRQVSDLSMNAVVQGSGECLFGGFSQQASVALAVPDSLQRNAARAKMVSAGRMTATARADIGAV
jgi:hypothetical protein